MQSLIALALATASLASRHDQIAAYLEPYVRSGNLSGAVLVVDSGKVVFRGVYGGNRDKTRYHIASLSMQFTAATVMRLVEQGKLSLDAKVSSLVPDVPNGEKITVRQLLQQNSGLPDANDLPGYDDLLKAHQTPATLVQFIRGKTPRHEPGGRPRDEEHSAYNVLTLIAEKVTGLPFKEVARREVFAPLKMNDSGIDDDSPIGKDLAVGHVENGALGMKDAPQIHWSAKTGNGSAYSTIDDERRWLDAFLGDKLLSAADRKMMLDWGEGYGWEWDDDSPRTDPLYFMAGNAPGFATTVVTIPSRHFYAVILSNLQIPVANRVAFDVAATIQGKDYHLLELRSSPITKEEAARVVGSYTFGKDFYRENATLHLVAGGEGLILRWPGGPDSPVLVVDDRHFIDRHYWTRFSVAEDGKLTFGKFTGKKTESSPAPTP